jgi:hypothetical protein
MNARERWLEVKTRAAEFMHERTVAFWGDHAVRTAGQPTQYGTGVLLQIDNVRMIVTAEHVADEFLNQGVSAVLAAGKHMFPLTRAETRRSKGDDIAIIVLNEDDSARVADERKFTRLDELACGDPTTTVGGIYSAFGYPHASSEVDHEARTMTMTATPCLGLPYADGTGLMTDFDDRFHVAIRFDSTNNVHPGGMSGGGIWRVHQAGCRADRWTEDNVKLVAIEHTLGRGHTALIATRIEYVLGLVRSFDPSLDGAIKLAWPMKTPEERKRIVMP